LIANEICYFFPDAEITTIAPVRTTNAPAMLKTEKNSGSIHETKVIIEFRIIIN